MRSLRHFYMGWVKHIFSFLFPILTTFSIFFFFVFFHPLHTHFIGWSIIIFVSSFFLYFSSLSLFSFFFVVFSFTFPFISSCSFFLFDFIIIIFYVLCVSPIILLDNSSFCRAQRESKTQEGTTEALTLTNKKLYAQLKETEETFQLVTSEVPH